MDIVVVDYGLGNLQSVYNALKFLNADVKVSGSPQAVNNAKKIIVPGVGAFDDTIKELAKRKLISPIKNFIKSGRIYLGICLGLQILFEASDEGKEKGLSVFKGRVRRFHEKGLKIPHMGWNNVKIIKKNASLAEAITGREYYYFVHSYFALPIDASIVAGITAYGKTSFASMIAEGNVYAAQFHPEKSQETGLRFLKDFVHLKD